MAFDIIVSPEAKDDLYRIAARDRSILLDAIERHLRHEPTKVSRSRVKRLRGLRKPQYRLRVDAFRVFYDVVESSVHILAIVAKDDVNNWLAQFGEEE
jgi:mRNA interferase RelE/StbE